jgi:uncharacterized protein YjbJ (UPF0337 family)
METKLKIKENWSALKKEIKQKYVALNDLDLVYSEGREDELLATISKKIGKTKEEVTNVIKDLQTKIASKPQGERVDAPSEKSRFVSSSANKREGVVAEKTNVSGKTPGDREDADVDADPRHIEASRRH